MSKRTDRIKEKVPLDQLLSDYGYKVRLGGHDQQFSCDLHGSGQDQKPSARYYHSTQTWFCFACGKARDVISTVMEKEGLEYPQACRVIEKKYGLSEWKEYQPEDRGVDVGDVGEEDLKVLEKRVVNKMLLITKERVLCLDKCLRFWEVIDGIRLNSNQTKEQWIRIYEKIEAEYDKATYDRWENDR